MSALTRARALGRARSAPSYPFAVDTLFVLPFLIDDRNALDLYDTID